MLQTKTPHKRKLPAKSLRGFLQYTGAPVPIDQLCKPVEYTDDRANQIYAAAAPFETACRVEK